VLCCSSAAILASRFRWPGDPGAAELFQKWAMAVWSAVRVALLAEPNSLTSLKAAVYAALGRAGGASGRNGSVPGMANGLTSGQCGSRPVAPGDVGRHWPIAVLPR
jgi:hypothetical protein